MKAAVLLALFASILVAVSARPCCGDGRCEYPIESCSSCPQDCGICPSCNLCGNRICDSSKGETSCNCPEDCGACCLDGVCREDKNETALNCPQDCAVNLRLKVVDDATNVALPQAAVRCSTPTINLGPRLTNELGGVGFENASGDSYMCTGELFGYLPGYVVAIVYPLSEPTVWIIRLKKNPACLEGTVYDAVTLVPLDNSTVFCQNGAEAFTTSTRITGTMGRYYFEPVPPGNYRCFADRSKYYPNSNEGSVEAGKMGIVDVYLQPLPGGLIGHVWVQSGSQLTPIPGATITCTGASNLQLPVVNTDSTGFYSIQNIAAGPVSCTASLTDYTSDFKVGIVYRSQNTTIDFIIAELPGQLIVYVQEETTLVNIPGASVECTSIQVPILPGLTDNNGTVAFGTVAAGTFRCQAVATGYSANSVSGVVVVRNRLTETTIYLRPLPGILIITTVDDSNDQILANASVTVSGHQNYGPQLTDVSGSSTWTVTAGTYSSTGSLSGYLPGSKSGFSVPRGGTTRVELRLIPLPGLLIVNVVATDINGPLPGATVVVSSQTPNIVFTNTSSAPSPDASLSYVVKAGVYQAFGSAVGYNTDTKLSGFIGRNQTVTVTLVLSPLPNNLIVQVLDADTHNPITFARVSLSGSNSANSGVDASAKAYFGAYAAGNWSATATATGYTENSTYVGSAVRNTTLFAIIYLRQLPCNVRVLVLSNNTGLPVSSASVSLTGVTGTTLTDADGVTTYSLAYDFATNPVASASRSGYSSGSTPFQCGRGLFVNVTIKLNEVLFIRLAAIDALTPSKPLLPLASIYFNDVLVNTSDPLNPAFRLQTVESLPIQAIIKGVAGGFNNKTSDTITFTLANRAFNISLAPQEFTLFFIPAEVMADGSYQRAEADGAIRNNYKAYFSETGMVYEEKPITAGGSATQISDPPTSASFTANTPITFTNTSVSPFTAFAARFGEQSPSNQSQFSAFYVQSKDLDTLKANAPNSATQLFVPVPDFAATPERTIVFDLPYKLNAAYFNIRVTPVDAVTFAKRNFGAQDFCFARVTLKRAVRYTNYDSNVLKLATRAIFESFITFGDAVGQIEMGFPVESYNNTLSNWADTETSPFPNVRPYASGAAPEELSKFDWPPTSLLTPLFTTVSATGQVGRNPSAKLFHLQDYVIVYQPRTKRSEN